MDADIDGLLIPEDHDIFEIEDPDHLNEALGMTRLYAALAHIENHPEYLAHIFHAIGKASFEERLGSSHPGFRTLPELPTPLKRYAAV